MTLRRRRILTLGLLAGGIFLWGFTYRNSSVADLRVDVLICAVGLGIVGAIVWRSWTQRTEAFLSRHRIGAALVMAAANVVATLIYLQSRWQTLCLRMHDDHVYMIQARMLARLRLWMPSYPADIQPFFDSFHLLMRPVYAGMYPPGTSLALVWGVWLHLPFWVMPMIAGSIAVGFFYLLLVEMFGGLRAVLGVVMMVCQYWERYLATAAFSELPFFLGQMLLWWGWMRWRKSLRARWAAVMGVAAGFCLITRPLDAVCFGAIVTAMIAFEFRRQAREILKAMAIMAAAAAPFVVVAGIQNAGLAGKWYRMAEANYLRQVYPAPEIGFFTPDFTRLDPHPGVERRTWMQQLIIPAYRSHTVRNTLRWVYPGMFQDLILVTLPHSALLILLPLSLLSLVDIRRWAFAISTVLFFLGYACVVFFLYVYMFQLTASIACLLFMAWDALETAWPRRRMAIGGFLFAAIAVMSAADLPAFNPAVQASAQGFHDREQLMASAALAHLPRLPALVLFRFDPAICDPHDEPVYNDGVAWPDDAQIVRARDLGARDQKLFGYYAKRQPQRWVYFYDRGAALQGREALIGPVARVGEFLGK